MVQRSWAGTVWLWVAVVMIVLSAGVPGASAFHDRIEDRPHHVLWNGTGVEGRAVAELEVQLDEPSDCSVLGGTAFHEPSGMTDILAWEHDGERRGWSAGALRAPAHVHVQDTLDTRTVYGTADGRYTASETLFWGSFPAGTHTITVAGEDMETWGDHPAMSLGFGCEDPFDVVQRSGSSSVELFLPGNGERGIGVTTFLPSAAVADGVQLDVAEPRGEVWFDGFGFPGTAGVIDVDAPQQDERWIIGPHLRDPARTLTGTSGTYLVEPTMSNSGFSWNAMLGFGPLDSFDELET